MATKNIQLTLPAKNSAAWDNPLNNNFSILDSVFGGTVNIALSGSDYILKTTETQNLRINITGALGAADLSVVFPDGVGGSWIVSNNTSTAGGSVFVKTASFTLNPVKVERSGSLFVFSDGSNMYSASSGGGASGNFLPLTGGTITGDLGVDKTLTVTGASTFKNNITATTGTTTLNDLKINGKFDLATTNLSVGSLSANGYILTGADKFGVIGGSNFNGDITVGSGNISLAFGGINVRGNGAANSFNGATIIPSSGSFTIKSGASFTVENGVNLNLSGTFKPSSIETASATITETLTARTVKASSSLEADTATISGDLTVKKRAIFEGGLEGGDGSTFTELTVDSPGYATTRFLPGLSTGAISGVITCTTESQPRFALVNEKAQPVFSVSAWLNMVTGKWTATGGVGIGIQELPSTITNVPGVLYEDNNQTFADVGKVIAHLYAEISALRSELSELKSGNKAV